MALSRGIFIVGAKRTAFGDFGGKIKHLTPTELQVIVSKAALQQAGVDPQHVDSCVVGNIIHASVDTAYIARHVALKTGCKVNTPGLTVNRLCGSGFQAMVSGAMEMLLDDKQITLTGGSENMSMAPYVLRNARFGLKFGQDQQLEDYLWSALTDQHIKTPMGITAENLAEKYKLSREDADRYALRSIQRWKAATTSGRFADEIVPITLKGKKGEEQFKVDEHPRGDTTIEILAKLPSVFKKNGTVTAGNASGVCDGAGAIVLATEEAVKSQKLKPLARLVAWSYVGCEPSIMGIGPAQAIPQVLKKAGKRISDIDLFDVNEAFASQFLAVEKELGLDPAKTNVNGGAIALGHPLAASGARITANLVYELKHRKGKFAVGSACIGGGQGIAVLLENVH